MALINTVLKRSPQNVKTLMAQGFVLQAREEWRRAKDSFDCVVDLCEDASFALRAQEESAWCGNAMGEGREAVERLKTVYGSLEASNSASELDLARCQWRIGQSYWNIGGKSCIPSHLQIDTEAYQGDERQNAFAFFIAALKKDPEYAAAFTSLGLHYAEFATPPDPIRASKCFQKAFELDPRETIAAERLANGFAEEQEWELLEVIAKRTIEGEGGLDAGIKSAKEGDAPMNVWAWRALGVVDLVGLNFSLAKDPQIRAFATAKLELCWSYPGIPSCSKGQT